MSLCLSLTDSEPKIGNVPDPDGQRNVEEHAERPHTHVDTRSSKSGIQNCERDSGGCETSASSDVAGTTKG